MAVHVPQKLKFSNRYLSGRITTPFQSQSFERINVSLLKTADEWLIAQNIAISSMERAAGFSTCR